MPDSSGDLLLFNGPWTDIQPSLSQVMLRALQLAGFEWMTPVQSAVIPLFLSNKDVVVEAITGSGKTLAFLVPILEMLARRRSVPLGPYEVGAIVIAPTRELARQIYEVLLSLLDCYSRAFKEIFNEDVTLTKKEIQAKVMEEALCHYQSYLCVGSEKVAKDIVQLKQKGGANIIIGTPGRLQLLLLQTDVRLSTKECEILVLDEADRLLDIGFKEALQSIICKLPKQRRTALFSATMSDELTNLIQAGLRNPVKVVVKVENASTLEVQRIPSSLSIFYEILPFHEKLDHMITLLTKLRKESPDLKAIIYFATCASVDYFTNLFERLPIVRSQFKLYQLHRKINASKRTQIYDAFSKETSQSALLLCTDIAARGLDINGIDWVVQFDPPQDPKAFIHRCGRAGRLGRLGNALFYIQEHESAYIDFLALRNIPLKRYSSELLDCSSISAQKVCQQTRSINASEKLMYEKSIPAFVSHIRFYQEHQAKFIFQFKSLDIISLTQLFGLLELPKMPELKQDKLAWESKFQASLVSSDESKSSLSSTSSPSFILPFPDVLAKRSQMALEAAARKQMTASISKRDSKKRKSKKRKYKNALFVN